jgi:hypothetical protein
MKIENLIWSFSEGWNQISDNIEDKTKANLIFVFGTVSALKINLYWNELREKYPNAIIVGGSSAGNILQTSLSETDIIASVIAFEQDTKAILENFEIDIKINEQEKSFEIGKNIVKTFKESSKKLSLPLKHIILFVGDSKINSSILIKGINQESKNEIMVSGGLMGEETFSFKETAVIANAPAKYKNIVAIGLYGEDLVSSSSSYAGWEDFGNERLITKSKDNILYEIDNEPALELYKRYLLDQAKDLPFSGLRFPLNIWSDNEPPIIRTVSDINEEENSLYFVGDVPQGYKAKLMKTNIDSIIDGSKQAAEMIAKSQDNMQNAFCLVVSCIGRRLVLDQLTEEELEVLADVLGENTNFSGFYSFGEIAPFSDTIKSCRLHNQTMTLTLFYEKSN